jgi:predicted MFS family arabinose efflux permease
VPTKDLPAANAIAGSAWGTMTVVGASLGGVLSQALSPYVCFVIDLCCLAVAAMLVLRVRRPMQAPRDGKREQARPLRELAEAVRFIAARPRVASLVTVKSAVGVGNGVLAVFPVLAATVFGLGAIATGVLFAARGLGALIGPLLLRRVLGNRSWLLPGMAISMLLYGVAYLGAAASPWFWVVLVCVMLAHLAGGGNWAMSNYALQLEVPDRLRGRVSGTELMIVSLSISASMLLAGALVDRVGPRWTLAVCACLTLCYAVVWRLVTRRLLRAAPAEVAAEPAAA